MIYALLTKLVPSRWLDIGHVFMDLDLVSVHKNAKKTYLLYGQQITPKNFAFAGTKREFPSGQDRLILPARGASRIIITCMKGKIYLNKNKK